MIIFWFRHFNEVLESLSIWLCTLQWKIMRFAKNIEKQTDIWKSTTSHFLRSIAKKRWKNRFSLQR